MSAAAKAMEHREALIAQCPPAPPRLPEADAARLPIHVTTWGASGPAVLIVHGGVQGGLGGGPSTFSKQEPLAQRGWRLQLVDRPGFGQSASRGVDDMQADAAWIADMLGDGANLIGHSWGGAEALLAAARRPSAPWSWSSRRCRRCCLATRPSRRTRRSRPTRCGSPGC